MSTTAKTVHPGGKNLHAVADYTLDNLGVPGDTIMQLTPEIAMQLFDRIVTQGHIAACLVNLPDHVPAMGDEAQKSLVLALDTVQERVYAAIGGAAELWIADKVAKATLPSGIVHMKAGKPVAAAA